MIRGSEEVAAPTGDSVGSQSEARLCEATLQSESPADPVQNREVIRASGTSIASAAVYPSAGLADQSVQRIASVIEPPTLSTRGSLSAMEM